MHDNYFDIVMAHIEENITWPTNELKREIPNLIGHHSRSFDEHFKLLTGYTLEYYIKQRRLHYAARELLVSVNKSICEIALEYQFSDQSAFTRALKTKYNMTPKEFRNDGFWPSEEPFSLRQFTEGKPKTRIQKILQQLQVGSMMAPEEAEIWIEIDEVNKEFNLDIDTCCVIMDLAERLGVPFRVLYHACIPVIAEWQDYSECIMDEDDYRSVYLGIDSEEERVICQYFNCEPGSLTLRLVEKYRERHK